MPGPALHKSLVLALTVNTWPAVTETVASPLPPVELLALASTMNTVALADVIGTAARLAARAMLNSFMG